MKWLNGVFWSLVMGMASVQSQGDAIDTHPAGQQLKRIFAAPVQADFKTSGVARADYLKLIAGNVDFFKKYQDETGAIIDPVSKGERQYSTPAFAAAAGLLVKEAGRKDLLEPATRAFNCALKALIEKRAADNHADFYIPLLVHAHRFLDGNVSPQQSQEWDALFKRIDPETMYRADLRGMNWNIVSCSGELLRRKDGLVAEAMRDRQMSYLEKCLSGHMKTLTPLGLFEDPGAPMAYDAFSRLWLDDVFADAAYEGRHADEIRAFLKKGGLSTLLLLSPTGEWASGGRSGLHNWTDLENTAICEINAVHWKREGRDDVAGAFKRAAHLAFQSAARWQRPSGEIWIVKNRAEPETRFAYESYSNHSQYNLLPMAMLAMAYSRADESIAERPSVSEVGGYVFDARETFHKIAAAAGGYYVLIDTAADAHYNATGLQRVHRAGLLYPSFSDTAAGDRGYGDKDIPKIAIAPGIQWKSADGTWLGLADFSGGKSKRSVIAANLKQESTAADRIAFEVIYQLKSENESESTVTEKYVLTKDSVALTSSVANQATNWRVQLPVLVSDGNAPTQVDLLSSRVSIQQQGSITSMELPGDLIAQPLTLSGDRSMNHNGHVQPATAPVKSHSIVIQFNLANFAQK